MGIVKVAEAADPADPASWECWCFGSVVLSP